MVTSGVRYAIQYDVHYYYVVMVYGYTGIPHTIQYSMMILLAFGFLPHLQYDVFCDIVSDFQTGFHWPKHP